MSDGEVADTSAREVEYMELYSVCACSAGELRGLKYAPGMVYSGRLK